MKTLVKQGDIMIAVECAPSTINFDDILDSAEVVIDEFTYETPWENCDGFEHTTRWATVEDYEREPRGFCWSCADGKRIVVELSDKADFGLYEYLRNRGASKQVAAEAVACQRRKTLNYLTSWYENGWTWYGVKCNFSILGKEYRDSIYGIDNEKSANDEFLLETARNVACDLEHDGFIVVGKPDVKKDYRERKRESVRFGLSLGTWKD